MSMVVEPDNRGNFSLYVKQLKDEDELQLREDFGEFGLLGVHRPANSQNRFLRFPSKEAAEEALRTLHTKYNVVPALARPKNGNEKPFKDSFKDKNEGFQKWSPRGSTEENNSGGFQKEERGSFTGKGLLGPKPEDKKEGFQKRSFRGSTEENNSWKHEENRGGVQKEERGSFTGRDSGPARGYEEKSYGKGLLGVKPEEYDEPMGVSSSTLQGRESQSRRSDGPPPLVRARHSQHEERSGDQSTVSTSNLKNDGLPALVPAKNLQNGGSNEIPQLFPISHLQNNAPDEPPLLTPARHSQNDQINGLPRLIPANNSRNGGGDCPPSLLCAQNLQLEIYKGAVPGRSSLSTGQEHCLVKPPDFMTAANEDWPKHADEMFIANISEYTSPEDILKLFASLQPVFVSDLKYTDIKAHLSYRIVKFTTCKAVTFALKYYQNFCLHGKQWNLTRFSTLVEMLK